MLYKQNRNKIKIALTLVGIATLLGVGGLLIHRRLDNRKTTESESINLNPPTAEEKSEAENFKTNVDNREARQQTNSRDDSNSETTPRSQKKNVNIIITDAGQYDDIIEVRSFLPDHYEDGNCTVTFTKADQQLTKVTPAKRDISSTICLNPQIKRGDFSSAGEWNLVVSYESPQAQGKSDQQKVIIK